MERPNARRLAGRRRRIPLAILLAGWLGAGHAPGEIGLPTANGGAARAPRKAASQPAAPKNSAALTINQPLRLRLELRDGSRIFGIPTVTNLAVTSSFGTVPVDLSRLESCQLADGQEPSATLVFRNGDRITGAIVMQALDLKTTFGAVRIPLSVVARLGVIPAGQSGGGLLNFNFGEIGTIPKTGKAAAGYGMEDYWNLVASPNVQTVSQHNLKFANGEVSSAGLTANNVGGCWGNKTGDLMFDSFLYPNGPRGDGVGDITVTLTNLPPGSYDFYLYGHAAAGANRGPSNSRFAVKSGARDYGPAALKDASGWKATDPWVEGVQYVVLSGIQVSPEEPVVITVMPGQPGGVAVINGLQIVPAAALKPSSPDPAR
jgi:hypothetical protein